MRIRKKPVEIEGVLITLAFMGDSSQWPGWFYHAWIEDWINPVYEMDHVGEPEHLVWLQVHTLNGCVDVVIGDWILCGVAGEIYPCDARIFEKTMR